MGDGCGNYTEDNDDSSPPLPLVPNIKIEQQDEEQEDENTASQESENTIHLNMPVVTQSSPEKNKKGLKWRCNRCDKKFKSKAAEEYHCKKVCPDAELVRIEDDESNEQAEELQKVHNELSEENAALNDSRIDPENLETNAETEHDWSRIDKGQSVIDESE